MKPGLTCLAVPSPTPVCWQASHSVSFVQLPDTFFWGWGGIRVGEFEQRCFLSQGAGAKVITFSEGTWWTGLLHARCWLLLSKRHSILQSNDGCCYDITFRGRYILNSCTTRLKYSGGKKLFTKYGVITLLLNKGCKIHKFTRLIYWTSYCLYLWSIILYSWVTHFYTHLLLWELDLCLLQIN